MRSVGIRKRSWFKTAGVVAFCAQILGGAGLAHAVDNACFPMPTFADQGDPPFDKLDFVSQAHWTGSSGYGWNAGGLSEQSYQAAIGTNHDYPIVAYPDVTNRQLVVSFEQNVAQSHVNNFEGMRIGFTYDYNDSHHGTEHVSQIIVLTFNSLSHGVWTNTPAPCSATSATTVTTPCANNPTKDPGTWSNLKPTNVQLLQQIDYTDGTATVGPQPWPVPSGDPTAWVREHTRLWIVSDSTDSTKFTWRLQAALALRNKNGAANSPDPTTTWASPGVFLDDNVFQADATKKIKPPFWLDVMATPGDITDAINLHYPDWADDTAVGRDPTKFSVPSTQFWGTGEMGSARDPGGITPGDLSCSGTGLVVETTVGDNVVWHSNLWNEAAGINTAGLFDDGGKLYMLKNGVAAQNQLAVQIKNTSSTPVDPTKVKAQFFIAPYGSQAIQTVWAPLSIGGNDFTCGGSTVTGQASCAPSPIGSSQLIDSQPVAGSPATVGQNSAFTLEQKGGWTPSADYICATQATDAPSYSWYYVGNTNTNQLCQHAVYWPNDATGINQSAAGLPAHACMQVQLSATGVQLATKSAFRNMHQGSASLHREGATIDTRGLKKIKNQSFHDIYLYVEKKNMPYRVDAGYSPRTYNTTMQVYNRANGGCDGEFCQGGGNGFDPSVPAPSEDWFAKYMPTMVVHAYADTGQYYTVGGQKVPVLTRMTSFGQFISHDSTTEGPVYGWDANLEPMPGTQFQKVGVDTYRIRIPNDKAGQVVTHVEPLPTRRPVCSGTVNMNVVQLLSSIVPLVQVSPECAGEINGLIDSLQIQCVDLQHFLNKILALDWGQWNSWIKFLVQQVEAASGCKCN